MRTFLVRLPAGCRYWTVLDDELRVVAGSGRLSAASAAGSGRGGGHNTDVRGGAGPVPAVVRVERPGLAHGRFGDPVVCYLASVLG